VRPTTLEEANRLFPTPTALEQSIPDSALAKPATEADRTATKGIRKYISENTAIPNLLFNSDTNEGANKEKAEAVVEIPTHNGSTALTRSALARIHSA
jgi:hypothetical protein